MYGSRSVMSYSLQIFQARILEWVAVPFSRGCSQPKNRTQIFHIARWILYHLSYHGFPGGISGIKNLPADAGDTRVPVRSLGPEDPLE